MMRGFRSLALVGFLLVTPVLLLAQKSDQPLSPVVMRAVEAVFPKDLLREGSTSVPKTCAVAFSSRTDTRPGLIAATYEGDRTEIAMLAYDQGVAHIIDTVTDQEFFLGGGSFCSVSIVNLADPANPASLLTKTVKFSYGGRDEQDWYFVWNGRNLVNITALDHDPGLDAPNSAMPDSYAVDLDHTGAMQIAGNNEDGDRFAQDDGIAATPAYTLFRFNGTAYAPAKFLLALHRFEAQPANWDLKMNGPWSPQVDMVSLHHEPAPSYKLTIVNGDRQSSGEDRDRTDRDHDTSNGHRDQSDRVRDRNQRVKSAKVEINGVPVVLPYEVNQHVETLTRTIQLQKENEIKVTVEGAPNSHIYVVIE